MKKNAKKYVNREISWLSFNGRVLQEATDSNVPLIEKIKFLGIFSSNLDEFFSVRVGTLKRVIDAKVKGNAVRDPSGGSPREVLNEIHNIVLKQRDRFDKVFNTLIEDLNNANIFIIDETELNQEQQQFVKDYFEHEVRPRLVPIMLDNSSEMPHFKNHVIYLAIYLYRNSEYDRTKYALIELPTDVLPRFIVLPPIDDRKYIILLDDIIRYGLNEVFYLFDYDSISAYTVKLTRDAELDISEDVTKSFFEQISESLNNRKKGQPVRLVYDQEMPEDLLDFILTKYNMHNFDNLIPGGRYHNAKDFINFPKLGSSSMEYGELAELPDADLEKHRTVLDAIDEKDIFLHFPYQSFDYIIDLLREAAIDPEVTSIYITLYRVAKNSNVINALINAIQNGKSVTVVMELKARFDEEANIHWTKKLREHGARLIDGVPGLKVHAKLCMITRRKENKTVNYGVVSTGNFNESTARIYSDHALFTADRRIISEIENIFDFFEYNYKHYTYNHLIVSPFYMRERFTKLIRNEINNAQEGKDAYIYIKLNNLVDKEMIDKLYVASQSGVKIKIIARSICSLVPGIEGMSENIEVISIVDRFLEHSRLFIFCNDEDEIYFISSADWMIRNLDNRFEVATPVYDPNIKQEIKQFFNLQFRDTQKARIINETQSNPYRVKNPDTYHRAQYEIYEFLNDKYNKLDANL
ncbi:MAG: polyphosphate kinase 1 [Methanohalobium sp.]|uniref:polyphosphate kinase 1 n=1 Tax=Methanohalobium sp. TaxID=2837493 RepID=UPI003978572F